MNTRGFETPENTQHATGRAYGPKDDALTRPALGSETTVPDLPPHRGLRPKPFSAPFQPLRPSGAAPAR